MKYNSVAIGGTFDRLHKGHREFLNFALSKSKKIIVGLTSDNYIKTNKPGSTIESYKKRKRYLEVFIKRRGAESRIEIVPIDNLFGPTLKADLPIDAIVVSDASKEGAVLINNARKKNNLPELTVVVTPMVKGEDGRVISSTRIRSGEINREGRLYINPLWLSSKIILPEKIRKYLKKPFGKIIKNAIFLKKTIDSSRAITIGDVVTKSFNNHSIQQKVSVVDFFVGREKKFSNFKELGFLNNEKVLAADNPSGCITPGLFKSAFEIINSLYSKLNNKGRLVLKINGEEDLAVLPFLLCCPLGFEIFYGQPGEGMVRLKVSERSKEKAYNLVKKFILPIKFA
ncbi:MAG: pantetheine-phosphate adenylyltransferase [Candidatus Levybacteria bacterium]|nr:pantetheine-phosphate adenylyltransferase [Candidatus Levybacteria bacterium]